MSPSLFDEGEGTTVRESGWLIRWLAASEQHLSYPWSVRVVASTPAACCHFSFAPTVRMTCYDSPADKLVERLSCQASASRGSTLPHCSPAQFAFQIGNLARGHLTANCPHQRRLCKQANRYMAPVRISCRPTKAAIGKWCRQCRQVLAASAFQLDRHSTDGLQSYCRECAPRPTAAGRGCHTLRCSSALLDVGAPGVHQGPRYHWTALLSQAVLRYLAACAPESLSASCFCRCKAHRARERRQARRHAAASRPSEIPNLGPRRPQGRTEDGGRVISCDNRRPDAPPDEGVIGPTQRRRRNCNPESSTERSPECAASSTAPVRTVAAPWCKTSATRPHAGCDPSLGLNAFSQTAGLAGSIKERSCRRLSPGRGRTWLQGSLRSGVAARPLPWWWALALRNKRLVCMGVRLQTVTLWAGLQVH